MSFSTGPAVSGFATPTIIVVDCPDDVYVLIPRFVEAGRLTSRQAAVSELVNQRLRAMSGRHNGELWTDEALEEEEYGEF